MKRLMMIVAVAFATLLGTQAALAQKEAQAAPNKGTGGAIGKHTSVRTYFGYMAPFLPSDVVFATRDTVGNSCNAEGYDVEGVATWRCLVISSKSTGLTYRVQNKRIFVVENGRPVLFVGFSQRKDSSSVEYMTPAAEQFALASGYRLDKGTSTMVAMNAPPTVAQAPIDCKTKFTIENMSQRGNCINGSTRTAAAPPPQAPAPAPQVPKAQNCANETNLLKRISCEAAAAAGK